MIKFNCTSCAGKIGVEDQYVGRRVKCPKCGNVNTVPAAAAAPGGGGASVAAPSPGAASAPGDADNILAEALRAQSGAVPPPVGAAPPPASPRPAPTVLRPPPQPPARAAAKSSGKRFMIIGAVVLIAMTAGGVYQGMRSVQAQKELNDELTKAKEAMKAHPGDAAVAGQQLQNLAAAADKASASMSGDQKEGAQAGAIAIRFMGELSQPYSQATAALAQAGSLKPGTLTSRDAVVARLALVKTLADTNEQFDRDIAALPQHLAQVLDKAGISENIKQATLKGISASNRLTLIRQVRQSDRDITRASTDMLTVFLDEWGRWKLVGDKAQFTNTQAVTRYNEAFHRLQAAAKLQQGLIAQVQALN